MSMTSPETTGISINPRLLPGKPIFVFPTTATLAPNQSHPNTTHELVLQLCAPFPPCNPLGCGNSDKAPIQCEECNQTAVAFTVLGMCLLAVLIVLVNLLVIIIITRTSTLQRRHGYIKVSLAVSDLLIGLLVLPAAIYNMTTHLYLPPQILKAETLLKKWAQTNSPASVFFGTVLVISLTSSLYNLLLLSLDRFLAVFRPLHNRSGKYFSRKRLSICIGIVWTIGLIVSSLPAVFPKKFNYVMDPTTFFYVQSTHLTNYQGQGVGHIALFSLVVLGIPYVLTVVFNILTLFITFRRLAVRDRIGSFSSVAASSRSKKERSEEARRMKLILDTCPEMRDSNIRSGSIFSNIWTNRKNKSYNNNNEHAETPGRLSNDRLQMANRSFKKSLHKPRNLNYRVTRMIVSMLLAFTVCVCPYVIVNVLMVNGELNCSNVGVIYNVAVYLVLFNSFLNFCIYNLWHQEFRRELVAVLLCQPKGKQNFKKSSNGISSSRQMSANNHWQIPANQRKPSMFSSGVSSFQQPK